MSDSTLDGRTHGEFERYGLLAALTLVILCLLLADRVRSAPRPVSPPEADRLLRVRIGGYDSTPRAVAAVPAVLSRPAGPVPVAPVADRAPAPAPRTCVVGDGETLGDIALRELGSSRRAREISDLNGIADVHRVRAGQTLRLPPR